MIKENMNCTNCVYGEAAGSFGSVRCIRYPEAIIKRPDEYCGEGKFHEEDCFNHTAWGEWEK